jgi:hypothetical protein
MADIIIAILTDVLDGSGERAGWLAYADTAYRALGWFLRATVYEDGSILP